MATIRKRGDRWQAQVRRVGAPTQTKSFLLKADAVAWAREQEIAIERGDIERPRVEATYTLRQLLQRYLETETPKKRGHVVEACVLRGMIADTFTQKPLRSLSVSDIAAYRDRRLQAVSAATVRRQMNILYRALKVAETEWDWAIPKRLKVRVGAPGVATKPVARVSPEQEALLLDAAKRSRNRLLVPAIQLALLTGLRRSELLNARWSDLDRQRKIWSVPQTKNGHARRIPAHRGGSAHGVLGDLRRPHPLSWCDALRCRPHRGGVVAGGRKGPLSGPARHLP